MNPAKLLEDPNRFWSKYALNATNGCWEWTSSLRNGYGVLRIKHKFYYAHRISWFLTYGNMPEGSGYHGTCVLHKCDNPKCINPTHLTLGSHLDNMRDMTAKSRLVSHKGESNGMAKLDETKVRQIRELKQTTKVSYLALSRQFQVDPALVRRICLRTSWVHVK